VINNLKASCKFVDSQKWHAIADICSHLEFFLPSILIQLHSWTLSIVSDGAFRRSKPTYHVHAMCIVEIAVIAFLAFPPLIVAAHMSFVAFKFSTVA
jgi:hypothetical protein